FFQAEDGIRDLTVTGVQTCALPILERDIFFSFFMFTADLRPDDTRYTRVLVNHLKFVTELGYDGVDVHIASRPPTVDHELEVERSEERRVGKECRCGWGRCHQQQKR